jgi:nucleoside-diphosphate-sugar epimerase
MQGHECFVPEKEFSFSTERNLHHIIYCVGITADFRSHPFETIEAHVCKLHAILQLAQFDSLLYLSSTRIYKRSKQTGEDAEIPVNPGDADDLYNLSKLTGESICNTLRGRTAKAVRLSNVVGNDFSSENFLNTIIKEALDKKKIVLQSDPSSDKDYIHVEDVVRLLPQILLNGKFNCYNLASGFNITHLQLAKKIQEHTGCEIEVRQGATKISFPEIETQRLQNEFPFQPKNILNEIQTIIIQAQQT